MEKISIDELKEQVDAIGKAVGDLKKTGMRESLLHYAIQRAAMKHHKGGPIPITHVKFILMGMDSLKGFMFPNEKVRK